MGDKDLPHFNATDESEEEDEAAMQAALREMVQIPDIDSRHRQPARGRLRIDERDEVWAQRLQRLSSADRQERWTKSKGQDTETQSTPRTAESNSKRTEKEEEKPKKKQSETWADRLKKSCKSEKLEKPKLPEIRPESTQLNSSKSRSPENPRESGYWQITSPSELMEQNIKHPLMDQPLKMMRIEAAANPKSNNPTRSPNKHMACTQTPHKRAITVATNTDATLETAITVATNTDASVEATPTATEQKLEKSMDSSPRQMGMINILTVPFRTALNLAPANDEDLTMPPEQMSPSGHFKNLPVFGRNRAIATSAATNEGPKNPTLVSAPSAYCHSCFSPTISPDAFSILASTPSTASSVTPTTSEPTLVLPMEAEVNLTSLNHEEPLLDDNPSSEQADDTESAAESIVSAVKRIFLKPFSGEPGTLTTDAAKIANETGDVMAASPHAVIMMPLEIKDVPKKKELELEQPKPLEEQSEPLKHSDSMQTLTIHGRRSHMRTTYVDHCHREQTKGIDKKAARKLIIASILCVFFMICEVVGGVLSNSLAIATDAAHLLSDLAGFLISLFGLYLAGRASTDRFNFGWHRAEVIGAMISVYFIWVITGVLVWLAVQRMIEGTHEVDAVIMLITSALAIVVNLIMAAQLSHGHSHGQNRLKVKSSHQIATENPTGKGQHLMATSISAHQAQQQKVNINVRAAIIHVVGDIIQSVGVFLAACVIFFKPEWAVIDSICTFVFSIIVLAVTFNILKDVMMVLMEAAPDYMDYGEVQKLFLSIEGVERVHNLRIWALSLDKIALSAHLAINGDADPHLILEQAKTLIHQRYKFYETTIQVEIYDGQDHDHLPYAPKGQPLIYPKNVGTDNPRNSLIDNATTDEDQQSRENRNESDDMHSLADSPTNETLLATKTNDRNESKQDKR
ncbi:hypothetical protein ACLKA6_019385 [Drosophila palustris]